MDSINELPKSLLSLFNDTEAKARVAIKLSNVTAIIDWIFIPIRAVRKLYGGLSVTAGFSQVIEESPLVGMRMHASIITCTIINKGEKSVYIQKPQIKTSRKIKGDRLFEATNSVQFPIKLEHGQILKLEYDAMELNHLIFVYLSQWDSVNFIIPTTAHKKYRSNSLMVSTIIENINMATLINRTNLNNPDF